MRFLFIMLTLSLPTAALAQDASAQPKPLPGLNEGGQAMLAIDNGGHSSAIFDLLFTRDGKHVIAVDVDKTVQVRDAVTGERLKIFRLPRKANQPAALFWAALAPDNNTLAISGYNLTFVGRPGPVSFAYLLDLRTGQLRQLPGFKQYAKVKSLSFSGDGDHLAIGIESIAGKEFKRPSVQVWSGLKSVWSEPLVAPQELAIPALATISDVVFAAQGSQLAVGVAGQVYRWDLAKADGPKQIKLDGTTGRLALSSDGSRLAVFVFPQGEYAKGELQVWSADGKLLKTISKKDLPATGPGPPLEFLFPHLAQPVFRDNEELLVAAHSGPLNQLGPTSLVRCDLIKDDVKTIQSFAAVSIVTRFRLSPDSKRMLATNGKQITVVNVDGAPKPLHIARALEKSAFNWSKQGYQIAWTGSSRDKLIAALDLETAALAPTLDPTAFDKAVGKLGESHSADRKYQAGQFFSDILIIGKDLISIRERNALLSIYVAGQDWVAWTPEGYYAASPGGEKLIGWHVNNGADKLATFYPVERFRKQLYRPDVIKLVLEKGSVAEALKTADAAAGIEKTRDVKIDDLLPPRAVLSLLQQDKATVKLKVEAEAAVKDQPVTALRLLVDGRPLADGAMNEKFGDGKKQAAAEWSITLPPGKHLLAVLARSPDASSKSNSIEVEVADPAKVHALHVLAIGVNDYEDSTLRLDFAAKDAQDIASGFQKVSKGELFQSVHSDVLVNARARKDAILKQLAELRKKVGPNDLAVIFFAGHGVKQKDKFYLLSVEAKSDNLAGTAISGDELRKALGEFPCQVLLMLDACHSSAGLKNFRPAVDDITRNLTDDDCGVAVMCAAMAHEKALEKGGNGLFTRAVVQALDRAEGVPYNRHNRLFFVHHLQAYVYDEVSQQSGDRQHPFLSLPWVVESFPVARFP